MIKRLLQGFCIWLLNILDVDLPPIRRSKENLYTAEYFKAFRELQNANKGIRRLKRKNEILQHKLFVANGYRFSQNVYSMKDKSTNEQS